MSPKREEAGVLAGFERDQRRRGLLETTIVARRVQLRAIELWAAPRSLDELDADDIERYLDSRRGRGGGPLSPRTRYIYLSNLHAYYAWTIRAGVGHHDPTVDILRPKVRPGLPRPIPDGDLAMALEAADLKLRAWLSLAAFSGLRCAEIAGLHRDDVMEGEMLLRVLGKGQKERLVPLHEEALAALQAYGLPSRGPVFTRDGRPYTPARVSREVAVFFDGLGIDATAHMGRHWFGTKAYRASRDLLVVAELLGHSSVVTTRTYAKFAPEATARAVAAIRVDSAPAHPVLPGLGGA